MVVVIVVVLIAVVGVMFDLVVVVVLPLVAAVHARECLLGPSCWQPHAGPTYT